jgi:exodeoxyribonuclease VIII
MTIQKINKNLDETVYRAIPALSATQLKTLKKSPWHLKYNIDNPSKPTEEMVFGTAVHAAWLEPAKFADVYVRSQKFDRRTTAGKVAAAEFAAANEGKIIIDFDDWTNLESMVANLNEAYGHLLPSCETELSIVVPDPKFKVTLKGRLDLYCEKTKTIYDLKTCQDASFGGFSRDVYKNDYALQCLHYLFIAKEAGLDVERFVFIPTEKKAPFSCAAYPIVFNLTFQHLWQERHEELRQAWAEANERGVYVKPHELAERSIVIN